MEIGMGIHGEPGISKIQITKVPTLVENLIEHLTRSKGLAPLFASPSSGSRVVLMVNNLGATTSIEIYVVTKYAIQQLEKKGIKVVRTLVGSFMTALNMTGFSLSLWHPTSDAQLELFDSPTNAQGWNYYVFKPVVATNTELFVTPSPAAKAQKLYTRPDKLTPTGIVIEKSIEAACKALIEAEPDLTRWDSKVGDGDCGITFKTAASAILAELKKTYPVNHPADCLRALALTVRKNAGGTSGGKE
jgi:dihydroxyacetone kinase